MEGGTVMKIYYDDKTDVLYIRFDERIQDVINKRVSEEIVLDIGEGNKIIGMEIIDASSRINLQSLLPPQYVIHNK